MRILRLLSAAVIMSLILSCGKGNEETLVDENEISVTGEAEDVHCFGATLCGYAHLTAQMSDKNTHYGIEISDDKVSLEMGKGQKVEGTEIFGDGLYKVVKLLEHNRTYYYRSYLQFKGHYYGEIRQVTTPDISLKVYTDEVEFLGNGSVKWNGHITFDGKEPGGTYRFDYGTSPDKLDKYTNPFSKDLGILNYSYTTNKDGVSLESGVTYYYKARVTLISKGNIVREGEVKSFKMP